MAKEESQLGLQGSLTPQRVDHFQRLQGQEEAREEEEDEPHVELWRL